MRCSNCDHEKLRVERTCTDTAESILRQRFCPECGYKVFTVEIELPIGKVQHQRGAEKMKRLPGALRVIFS